MGETPDGTLPRVVGVLRETLKLIEAGELEATAQDRACLVASLDVLDAHVPERRARPDRPPLRLLSPP